MHTAVHNKPDPKTLACRNRAIGFKGWQGAHAQPRANLRHVAALVLHHAGQQRGIKFREVRRQRCHLLGCTAQDRR